MVFPLHHNFTQRLRDLAALALSRLLTFGPPYLQQVLFPLHNCRQWAVWRLPLSTVANPGHWLENSKGFALPSMDQRVRSVPCSVESIPSPL